MEITINKVKIEFDENGFQEDLPGISVTAAAPDGETEDCYWYYKEMSENAGIYELADFDYSEEDQGHVDFINWLMRKTDCNDDDAKAAMTKIFKSIDKTDKYSYEKQKLIDLYDKESTVLALTPGTMVNNQAAKIFKTSEGKYLGTIFDCSNLIYITEMSRDEFNRCKEEACEYYSGDYERYSVIYDAIMQEIDDEE